MNLLYMRRFTIGRQSVYYLIGPPAGGQPIYFRDGFPQLVSICPSFFNTINEAALAGAEMGMLVDIDNSLYPPK